MKFGCTCLAGALLFCSLPPQARPQAPLDTPTIYASLIAMGFIALKNVLLPGSPGYPWPYPDRKQINKTAPGSWWLLPLNYSYAPSHLTRVLAYPVTEESDQATSVPEESDDLADFLASATNIERVEATDEFSEFGEFYNSDPDEIDFNTGQLSEITMGSMMGSMIESYFQPLGADMSSSTVTLLTGTLGKELTIDASLYPSLSTLMEGIPGNIYGTLPEELLRDLDRYIQPILVEFGSVPLIPQNHILKRLFNWLCASGGIYALKQIYLDDPGGKLNSFFLTITTRNLDDIIRFYNVLCRLRIIDMDDSDSMITGSIILQAYLKGLIEGSHPTTSRTTLEPGDQPVSVLFAAITYKSALLRNLIERGVIKLNLKKYRLARILLRRHYASLLAALDTLFGNLIENESKRKRLTDAFVFILLFEPDLLGHLLCLDIFGNSKHEQGVPALLSLIKLLNGVASQSGQSGQQVAVVIVSMMHMPFMIPMLNHLTRTFPTRHQAFSHLIQWLSNHHGALLGVSNQYEMQPVLNAVLYSFYQHDVCSGSTRTSTSAASSEVTYQEPPAELLNSIQSIVTEWISQVQLPAQPQPQPQADEDEETFEDLGATGGESSTGRATQETYYDSLNPRIISHILLRLYPELQQSSAQPEEVKKLLKELAKKPFKFSDSGS